MAANGGRLFRRTPPRKAAKVAADFRESLMLRQIPLQFQSDPLFERVREDLSAAYLAPDGYLRIASDELPSLERVQWNNKEFKRHESFLLADFLDLPAGADGEIDIEGLLVARHYLWMVGSHSRKMKKPRGRRRRTFSALGADFYGRDYARHR